MEFKYTKKETYTQEDLDGILKGYEGYQTKKYQPIITENENYKMEKKNAHLESIATKYTDAKKTKALIKLTDIKADMTDEQINEAFKSTLKENDFLNPHVHEKTDDKTLVKQEDKKEEVVKNESLNNLI